MNETVSNTVAEMIVEFGPDGMVSSVYTKRPKTAEDGSSKIEMVDWFGRMHDYQEMFGVMIPTRMEAGWRNEETGELESYFKGENFGFQYKMLS